MGSELAAARPEAAQRDAKHPPSSKFVRHSKTARRARVCVRACVRACVRVCVRGVLNQSERRFVGHGDWSSAGDLLAILAAAAEGSGIPRSQRGWWNASVRVRVRVCPSVRSMKRFAVWLRWMQTAVIACAVVRGLNVDGSHPFAVRVCLGVAAMAWCHRGLDGRTVYLPSQVFEFGAVVYGWTAEPPSTEDNNEDHHHRMNILTRRVKKLDTSRQKIFL